MEIFHTHGSSQQFALPQAVVRGRPHAILCTRGHLIHTEFQRRDYPSPCMPSDPLTLRLFAVLPSRTDWKAAVRGLVARKVKRFRQNGRPVRKFNNGEEIIRPEIRGDVVVSAARARERGLVDVCPEKFTARPRRRNEEAKSKINIRKV